MKNDMPQLKLESVTKIYDTPQGIPSTEVLKGVNLIFDAGQSLAIIGPSGSGKSTLLNIMGALDKPTEGRIFMDGEDLTGLDDKKMAEIRNQKIGFVFQFHHLLPQCTVLENVMIPTLVSSDHENRKNAESRAKDLLKRVGLDQRLDYRPGQLSGGECQRVAVVRSLINQPELILADEPTGSLDYKTAESLAQLLVDLNKEENVALIVVTHSESLAKYMNRISRLEDGILSPPG